MPDREKLIELIHSARFDIERICNERFDCDGCPADIHEGECKAGYIADHLIANGVTVQQWIPASEPPKDTYEYWIAYKAGGDYYYSTGYYDGTGWYSALTHHKIPVTHWMPLPKAPAEDK